MNYSWLKVFNWPILLLISWLLMFWSNVYLTWPLWSKTNTFPWIPFSEHFLAIPYAIDGILLIILLCLDIALLVAFIRNAGYRNVVILLFSSSLMLVFICLLSIGRFQPWVWQSVLIPFLTGLQIILSHRDQKVQAFDHRQIILQICQYLTISIYFFSATSKLNESYRHGIGSEFIGVINAIVPIYEWSSFILPSKYISDALLWLIVLSELQIALCLYFRRTRLIGNAFSILMHLFLLVILGPYGAKQESPVLIWNIYFIIQNTIIFSWQSGIFSVRKDLIQPVPQQARFTARIPEVKTVVLLVLMLPMLYWFNCYDPWLSWALYSPPATEITINFIDESIMDNPEIPLNTSNSILSKDTIILQQYCLKSNHAPLLPAEHYQLAVTYWYLSRFNVNGIPVGTNIKRNYAAYRPYIVNGFMDKNNQRIMTELEQAFRKSFWNSKVRSPD